MCGIAVRFGAIVNRSDTHIIANYYLLLLTDCADLSSVLSLFLMSALFLFHCAAFNWVSMFVCVRVSHMKVSFVVF